jgi:hypothetical protein
VSTQLAWRVLDWAGEATTAVNRLAFLPQTLAFSGQNVFWPRKLPEERYNSNESIAEKQDFD